MAAVALATAACGAQPAAPAATSGTPQVTPSAAGQAATEVDSGGAVESAVESAAATDSSSLDVAIRAIVGSESGRTSALHEVAPTAAFTIIVHAPSTEDIRYFRHASMLDVLFHPHDPAPGVLYVFSSPSQTLKHPAGRHRFQVEADDARALQSRFGDFAVLVLDARGRLLGAFSEPVLREAIHELVGHRDRKDTAPRPPHP